MFLVFFFIRLLLAIARDKMWLSRLSSDLIELHATSSRTVCTHSKEVYALWGSSLESLVFTICFTLICSSSWVSSVTTTAPDLTGEGYIKETILKSSVTQNPKELHILYSLGETFINKVLICVISFKYKGNVGKECVRPHQAFKDEHVWKTKPWFSCIFYILFRKRREHFCSPGTLIYKALQSGWESKCPQCAEDNPWLEAPQSGVYQDSPFNSSVHLCVFGLLYTMKSVPPSDAVLQCKGAGPSYTLKGTGMILPLLKNSCVGVAHLAMTELRRAQFFLLREALTNRRSMIWVRHGASPDQHSHSPQPVTK